jgi:adenylate cyclase
MKNPLKRWDVFLTLLVFLVTIPAERFEVFSMIEDQTISFRHILRTTFGDPDTMQLREEIMLVALDEDLYDKYGSFPFRRTDLGKMAEILSGFGAKVIGLDFLMDFRSSYGEDEPTAAMFSAAGDVLLVSYANFQDGKFVGLAYPTETLFKVAKTGYSNLEPTSAVLDNLARLRIYEEITNNKDGWPFAIQALAMYLDVEARIDDGMLVLGDLQVPLDQFGDIYIDFPRLDPGTQYLSEGRSAFSALEILDLVDLPEDEREEYKHVFGGKIVLVGDTWEVTHDKFNTPVGQVYGVEIIADSIHTLLNGAPLRPASTGVESVATLAFLILVLATGILRSLLQRLVAATVVYILYIAVASATYVYVGTVLSMTYTLLAGLAALLFMSLRFYVLSERQQLKSAADSAESNRMLGLAFQGQGQLDAAFDKFRNCPLDERALPQIGWVI